MLETKPVRLVFREEACRVADLDREADRLGLTRSALTRILVRRGLKDLIRDKTLGKDAA